MADNQLVPNLPGILTLHASAVAVNGEAFIFLGPSETGKSTICRLLAAYTQPLADDLIYLAHCGGAEWKVANAEFDTQVHNPPLRAIFRLYQAPAVRLEQLDDLQICRHLTDAFFEAHWQRQYDLETKKSAFTALAVVARSIPGFRLHFNLSISALELAKSMQKSVKTAENN